MNNYKPYSYLYKRTMEPARLKSCFVVMIPAGKKITLREGDPSTNGSETKIRYDVSADSSQHSSRQEEHDHEFAWDGNPHDVVVEVVESGSIYGNSSINSNKADRF
jgi:hypothetical protein